VRVKLSGLPVPGGRNVDQRAYDRGYHEGRSQGENDARRNRSYDYNRHGEYRDADDGFRGGNRNAYKDLFRRGFVEGYNDGYRRYARNGYPDYPTRRYPSTTYPTYPSYPTYPDSRGRYNSPASDVGYRDGFDQCRDDARDGDRFDPVRSSRYRSGDHEYNSRYGSRDDYKRDYRTALQRGYEQGYNSTRR
jgi:hypothetical protein